MMSTCLRVVFRHGAERQGENFHCGLHVSRDEIEIGITGHVDFYTTGNVLKVH